MSPTRQRAPAGDRVNASITASCPGRMIGDLTSGRSSGRACADPTIPSSTSPPNKSLTTAPALETWGAVPCNASPPR